MLSPSCPRAALGKWGSKAKAPLRKWGTKYESHTHLRQHEIELAQKKNLHPRKKSVAKTRASISRGSGAVACGENLSCSLLQIKLLVRPKRKKVSPTTARTSHVPSPEGKNGVIIEKGQASLERGGTVMILKRAGIVEVECQSRAKGGIILKMKCRPHRA